MRIGVTGHGALIGLVAIAALAGCKKDEPTSQPQTNSGVVSNPMSGVPVATPTAKPQEPKDPIKESDADMRKVLEALVSLNGKPIESLSPVDARKQPTPADAVKKVLTDDKKSTAPIEMGSVVDKKIPGAGGQLDARIYTPKTDDKGPLPVVAYWHGGGFVIANLDTYDASARALAKEANAIVVSLDYRHAPEAKFPAAHDDAFAGYKWVLSNAASFNGDPKRVAVAGESAGGNLAANVSIMARDKNVQLPLHELLIYPVAQTDMNTKSYQVWANAKPLDKAMMGWFVQQYTNKPDDTKDTRIDLVHANLAGLPKTTIINAEIDPLANDGDQLKDALDKAKVDVDQKTYQGVTHEFFGMGAAVDDAKSAESYGGGRLKDSLKKK